MLKIEIFKEDVHVEQSQTRPKDGKQPRTLYNQTAYVYLGGKFPVQMKIGLEENQTAYAAGIYTIKSESYSVNNFGSLELKKYGQILELVTSNLG